MLTISESTDANSSTSNSAIIICGVIAAVSLMIIALLLMKFKKFFTAKQVNSDSKTIEFDTINNDCKIGQDLIEKTLK